MTPSSSPRLSELGWGGKPRLFDRQPGDRPPGDLRCGPLEEVQEDGVPQLILYLLKGHSYVSGDTLHECPLLMEEILKTRVCGLWVPACNHSIETY